MTTTTPKTTSPSEVKNLVRFDLSERIQHIIMMTSFTILGLTGLPQSFASAGWAKAWMGLFGGIAGIRQVHHIARSRHDLCLHLPRHRGDRRPVPQRRQALDAAGQSKTSQTPCSPYSTCWAKPKSRRCTAASTSARSSNTGP